jgi:hypothetical protein
MSKRLTQDEFIKRSKLKHDNKYNYDKVNYIDAHSKVTIICPVHDDFEQTPNSHHRGAGCSKCAGNSKPSTKEFIRKAMEIHGEIYGYKKVKYTNNKEKVLISCLVDGHGDFEQVAEHHLRGCGCPKCAGTIISNAERFIEKARSVHGELFNYTLVDYINSKTKVFIICQYGHQFEQEPTNHLQGQGCPVCAGIKKLTQEEFIKKANIIHGGRYIYDKTKYINNHTKVIVSCLVKGHGDFWQQPNNHLQGQGCPKCCGLNKSAQDFIKEAMSIHGEKYIYDNTNYINSETKVLVTCGVDTHGDFWQLPRSHLYGQGCPKCGCGNSVSRPETSWLDSLNILMENRQVKILNFQVDGYDPETNTVYEFNGDFWHGNPIKFKPLDINPRTKSTFGDLYEKTKQKEQTLINAGYNVISIWESDWKKSIKVLLQS